MCTNLLLSSLILLCLAIPTQAADINAASCSSADVQTAINSAVDGDRVLIPAGNCTWNSQVLSTNKGITIQGAGIGVTIITNDVSIGSLNATLQAGDPTFYVTAITFDGNGLVTAGNNALVGVTGGGLNAFRIHHAEFINLNGTAITVNMAGFEVSGLVDNNTFKMGAGAGDKSLRIFGESTGAGNPFARGLELGSEKFIFIEDNTFTYTQTEDGAMDAFDGARYVFRHNVANETTQGHHGADSGGFRGVHSFEIYENTYARPISASDVALMLRSATGVIFNNTWTGNHGSINLANFRSRPQSFAQWGACDGTSIWDENQPGESGYACLDQIGHTFLKPSGGTNNLNPLYAWSNAKNGSPIAVTVSEVTMENHIKPDRDYYVEDSGFDGTSGIGVGLISARPSACIPIVGYWATDESKLYRCTATDTWTLYYTPFTYPHPLRGQGPDPATNLSLIVR